MPSDREGRGALARLGVGSGWLPVAVLEHRGLEGAELGHAHEADEVAAVGQLGGITGWAAAG